MKIGGGNNYELPDMGKMKLRNVGQLPISIQCPPEVVQCAMAAMNADGESSSEITVVNEPTSF